MLLAALLSPVNVGQAREILESMNPNDLLDEYLSPFVSPIPPSHNICHLALVLLRSSMTGTTPFLQSLDENRFEALKRVLLELLFSTKTSPEIKIAAAHCIGELCFAIVSYFDDFWPEACESVLQNAISSASAPTRAGCLACLTAGLAESIFQIDPSSSLQMLKGVLEQALVDPHLKVRTQAIITSVSCCYFLQMETDKALFLPVFAAIITTLGTTVMHFSLDSQVDTFDAATKGIEAILDIIAMDINLFREVSSDGHVVSYSSLESLAAICLQLSSKTALETARTKLDVDEWKSVRRLSFELLVSMCEASPPLCRKLNNNSFVQEVVRCCFEFLVEGEDDLAIGEENLSRVIHSLGTKSTMRVCLTCVEVCLSASSSSEANRRRGGLCGLTVLLEYNWNAAGTLALGDLINSVLNYLKNDPDFGVRLSATNCIASMCTNLSPELHNFHHAPVVSTLLLSLDENVNASSELRVQTCGGLISFVQLCPVDILQQYSDAIMGRLVQSTRGWGRGRGEGEIEVVQGAVTAIGTMAATLKLNFDRYYTPIVTLLQAQFGEEGLLEDGLVLLKCKMLESISTIFLAVGKDIFGNDGIAFLRMIATIDLNSLDDNIMKTYLLQAWARMAKAVEGENIAPFLPLIIPCLVKSLQQKIEVGGEEEGEEGRGEEQEEELESSQIKQRDGSIVNVRTAALEDLLSAIHTVLLLSQTLRGHFYHYIHQVLTAVGPLVKSVYDDVKVYALSTLQFFVLSAACFSKTNFEARSAGATLRVANFAIERIAHVLTSEGVEASAEAIMTCYQSLTGIIFYASGGFAAEINEENTACLQRDCNGVTENQLHVLVTLVLASLASLARRRAIRYAESQFHRIDNEFDAEAETTFLLENTEDEKILSVIAFFLGILVKSHAVRFMSLEIVQGELTERLVGMSKEHSCVADRIFSIGAFVDFVEFGVGELGLEGGDEITKIGIENVVGSILGGVRSFVMGGGEEEEETDVVILLEISSHGCLCLIKNFFHVLEDLKVAEEAISLLSNVAGRETTATTATAKTTAIYNSIEALSHINRWPLQI
ncbi:hypothetical protein ScalyP_jg4765 [Parmales sp. scaly parma]|nr:hypothetical protein ScalyP_jg4765 [Parmales sp. scaly parma]